MTKRKTASPAQLAARKRFAEMARSGAFKKKARKNPTAKKRAPAKRRGPDKLNAPSQTTGKRPTTRLKKRRTVNTRAGVYPNPSVHPKVKKLTTGGFRFAVQTSNVDHEGPWKTLATFGDKDRAHEYAKALSATRKYKAVRVFWK